MIGNFFELGPWLVTDQLTLKPNPYSWNRRFSLLFIDNPIGAGFSIASSPEEIPKDQPTVAKHLWIALQSFLSSDPSFRSRPLYLTGESYAGKYVPSAGYYILQRNLHLRRSDRINLRGIAIGNGLAHPVAQANYLNSLATSFGLMYSGYFSGLINEKQRAHLKELQQDAVRLTLEEKWLEAANARNKVLSWLQDAIGLATLHDLRRKQPYETEKLKTFLRKEEVVEALGAGKGGAVWSGCGGIVGIILHGDVMKSVKFMVGGILRGKKRVRVLVYQGMFDLRDGVVSTEAWVKELEWEGMERFFKAGRKVWKVRGEEVAGYVQRWGS